MEFFLKKNLLFRTGKQNVIIVFVCRNSRNKLELLSRKNKKKKQTEEACVQILPVQILLGFFCKKKQKVKFKPKVSLT